MKALYGNNIDNDWNNFLMGCTYEEEPHHSKKSNNTNNNTHKNNRNSGLMTDNVKSKKRIKITKNEYISSRCHDDDSDQELTDVTDSYVWNETNYSHGGGHNYKSDDEEKKSSRMNSAEMFNTLPVEVPSCSPIYISTKTKISFLNKPIDIKKVFWDIPIMPYASQCSGIIKKQIKFSCTTREELEEIEAQTKKEFDKNESFIETQIIEHIDNPDGRIKFKDHRKINIGLSKKDILNCRCKKKRAFFNCFVLIIRVEDENSPPDARIFKEMHIKVFNTGKLEIPGIQHNDSLQNVIDILIRILKTIVGEHIECQKDNCETVLINSNFNCGFYIDRDKLYNILKYKYRINSNYDSCSYPGIQ
jgi:hypothetical protein